MQCNNPWLSRTLWDRDIEKKWVKGSSLNTVLTLLDPDWLFWNVLCHGAEHYKPCRFQESLAYWVQHKKNAQNQVRFGKCIKVVRPDIKL